MPIPAPKIQDLTFQVKVRRKNLPSIDRKKSSEIRKFGNILPKQILGINLVIHLTRLFSFFPCLFQQIILQIGRQSNLVNIDPQLI